MVPKVGLERSYKLVKHCVHGGEWRGREGGENRGNRGGEWSGEASGGKHCSPRFFTELEVFGPLAAQPGRSAPEPHTAHGKTRGRSPSPHIGGAEASAGSRCILGRK